MNGFYARLRDSSNHDLKLQGCVKEVIDRLEETQTSQDQPGMLLGKIQSGKTRGFLGIIAEAFDRNYDIAVVLTKGTRTLAKQTVSRISHDFRTFIEDDEIGVYDIMEMPASLAKSEINRKLIIIVKKEANNLRRLLSFFQNENYPTLINRKLLLVDDEADMASIRFQKKPDEDYTQGTIAQLIDDLRSLVKKTSFLQVTATPYALYLQPEEYRVSETNPFQYFSPKKPSFTVLLPIHGGYVGGEDYFGEHAATDPRYYLYKEVSEDEHEALRSKDGRTIRQDRIWTSQNIKVLRMAVMSFLTAVVIRQRQQENELPRLRKYAMIIHIDTQKAAHKWQYGTIVNIRKAFEEAAETGNPKLRDIFESAFDDLEKSATANGDLLPERNQTFQGLLELLNGGEIIVERVNSDVQVSSLLDATTAELKLRTAANIFIGGSLLDRGITIPNLISFYYGRNPKRMQADTVLQHSRMYGNRDRKDLAVTRFYTSKTVYDRLRNIDKLENALREEFETGEADASIIFIQNDARNGISPCAPSKISMSEITTVKPCDYYAPSNFDTIGGKKGKQATEFIDRETKDFTHTEFAEISLASALELIEKSRSAIQLDTSATFSWEAMTSLLSYYSQINEDCPVKILVAHERRLDRINSADKSGKSLVGGDTIRKLLSRQRSAPAIVMTRQCGVGLNWTGEMPFWLPILVSPTNTAPCVFAQ